MTESRGRGDAGRILGADEFAAPRAKLSIPDLVTMMIGPRAEPVGRPLHRSTGVSAGAPLPVMATGETA